MADQPNRVYIKLFAPIISQTVQPLMQKIHQRLQAGVKEFGILISSPGGDVFQGLSVYNYLRGIPAKIITHNFGSVDSIGVVIFCAGDERYSVPHARFLVHTASANFPQCSLEEKQLEERLKGLRIDTENIAKVLGDTIGQSSEEIISYMQDRTTWNPEKAKELGLVHEIKSELFESGAEVVAIHGFPQGQQVRTDSHIAPPLS